MTTALGTALELSTTHDPRNIHEPDLWGKSDAHPHRRLSGRNESRWLWFLLLGLKLKCPVLIHGLKDTALLSPGLNGKWDFVEKDFTLVTIPDAGHFVQQDAPELVTRSIRSWLAK